MVTALVILLIICSFIFLSLAVASMYLVGLFNSRVAKRTELVLFTIANLRPSHKNTRRFPRQLVKLVRVLIHRRRLLANKIRFRKLKKEIDKQKTRPH